MSDQVVKSGLRPAHAARRHPGRPPARLPRPAEDRAGDLWGVWDATAPARQVALLVGGTLLALAVVGLLN